MLVLFIVITILGLFAQVVLVYKDFEKYNALAVAPTTFGMLSIHSLYLPFSFWSYFWIICISIFIGIFILLLRVDENHMSKITCGVLILCTSLCYFIFTFGFI